MLQDHTFVFYLIDVICYFRVVHKRVFKWYITAHIIFITDPMLYNYPLLLWKGYAISLKPYRSFQRVVSIRICSGDESPLKPKHGVQTADEPTRRNERNKRPGLEQRTELSWTGVIKHYNPNSGKFAAKSKCSNSVSKLSHVKPPRAPRRPSPNYPLHHPPWLKNSLNYSLTYEHTFPDNIYLHCTSHTLHPPPLPSTPYPLLLPHRQRISGRL